MMRKLDNKRLDNKRLENKKLENKKLDNKRLDNKRLDNKKIDNKKLMLLSLSLILIALFMILNGKHESLVLELSENTDDIELVREEIGELVDGRTVLCESSKLRSVFTEKHSGIFVKTFYSNTDKQNCEGYICIGDQRQFMNSTSRLRTRVAFFKVSNFLNSEEHDEKTILNDYVKITRIASGDVAYDSALDSLYFVSRGVSVPEIKVDIELDSKDHIMRESIVNIDTKEFYRDDNKHIDGHLIGRREKYPKDVDIQKGLFGKVLNGFSLDFGDYKLNQNGSNYVFDLKFENIGETESSNVKSNLILEYCF
jgi:hypothetical protein